jgi:hypothetical protein
MRNGSPGGQIRHRAAKVEEAQVEYSEVGCMPLPDSVNLDEVMETVLKSMPFSSGKSRLAWRTNLQSEPCRRVIHDAFWFFVSHLFNEDQEETQDRLVFRIADNYVRLFYLVSSEHKDQFFGRFYDSLAQIGFHSFHQA